MCVYAFSLKKVLSPSIRSSSRRVVTAVEVADVAAASTVVNGNCLRSEGESGA